MSNARWPRYRLSLSRRTSVFSAMTCWKAVVRVRPATTSPRDTSQPRSKRLACSRQRETTATSKQVPLLETKPDVAATTVVLEGPGAPPQALVFGRDFSTTGQPFESAVDVTAPLVFMGYGVEAPELKHDDYRAADVKGKIAVLLFGAPSKFPATSRAHYASAIVKAETAARHGAVGIVRLASPRIRETLSMAADGCGRATRGAVLGRIAMAHRRMHFVNCGSMSG